MIVDSATCEQKKTNVNLKHEKDNLCLKELQGKEGSSPGWSIPLLSGPSPDFIAAVVAQNCRESSEEEEEDEEGQQMAGEGERPTERPSGQPRGRSLLRETAALLFYI